MLQSSSTTPHFINSKNVSLEEYFSEENIIHLLCKYRVKAAKNNHKNHLFREISSSEQTKNALKNKPVSHKDIISLLPPRRQWVRPNKIERHKSNDTQKINIKAIKNKIKITHSKYLTSSIGTKPIWFNNLYTFIQDIQNSISYPSIDSISKPFIKPIKKEEKKECEECRALSMYNLKDRVIISLLARYFTDLFDTYFLDNSYAFRSTKYRNQSLTHHDTILKILDYKKNSANELWVSECDIRKFFDCVSHDVVLKSLDKITKDNKVPLNDNALVLFKSYLNSYSFNNDVFKKNGTDFFEKFNLTGCKFNWPDNDLLIQYYEDSGVYEPKIGVPQGGAISCFIANLVMHEVDKAVVEENLDDQLLYIRFCDDMIILHPEKAKCQKALDRYIQAISEQKLLIHRAHPFTKYNKDFWDKANKSKLPYRWAKKDGLGNVPWLSFVGYQIRFDGEVRIRKQSLDKEINKQKKEINEILKALGQKTNNYFPDDNSIDVNSVSRKSISQQIHSAESRLINMSVGRVNLYNKDKTFSMCWTNGFRSLNHNHIIKSQLKKLDRSRSKNLFLLRKKLSKLTVKPSNIKNKKLLIFYGAPFSYYYFLHRINK